jgi:hypothetical protein
MEAILKTVGSAVLAYSTHYGMTKLYSNMCVPDGIWGYLGGMVSTGSPVCQAGVHIISNTQISYSSIIMMGASRILVDLIVPGSSEHVKG